MSEMKWGDFMARPKKCRRVCSMPENSTFLPTVENKSDTVILLIEEFETVRLIDYEGYNQFQSAEFMGVSRTTVQEIYDSARKKISLALVKGLPIKISGGNYILCNGCYSINNKGEVSMIIAVTYDEGNIFQHFGHTEFFKLYKVENEHIISSEILSTNGSGHGALGKILSDNNVDILICGGIGAGAQKVLSEAGIKLFGGVSGSADDAVNAFIENRLEYNPQVKCSHHNHEHSEGHICNHGKC